MTTESSSLLFGVRTTEAVASLELLQRELDKTLQKFQAISASGPAKFAASGAEAIAATKVLSKEIEAQSKVLDKTGKDLVTYTQRVGNLSYRVKIGMNESASAVIAAQEKIKKALADPAGALAFSKNFTEMEASSKKFMSDLTTSNINLRRDIERITAQSRQNEYNLNKKYDAMTIQSRIKTLETISRLQATGKYSKSELSRDFGSLAVNDVGSIAALTATANQERELERIRRQSASTLENNTKLLGSNTAAMRDAHSVARGLSGSLGALWVTYGSLVPLLAGAAVGGAASQTFNVGKDIEYRLTMMEALGNEAVKVGQIMDAVNSSMKTPLEGAQALQVLAQAGLDTRQSLAALSTTLQLATLGEMEVADAAMTLTAALSTYKIEASDSIKVGDLFAKAATMSNASVQDLAESLKQAGAGAATYGVTLEETVAMLATLADSGIKASAAGTAVKNAMQEIYAPTDKAAKAMKQMGLEAYDANTGKARNYIEILRDLKRITIDMSEESRANFIGTLFNERSRRAIQIFMADMTGLNKAINDVGESTGYLARANDKLLDTVEGASNRFQSVMQQSYVNAFTTLNPLIRQTIASMEAFVASDSFVTMITTTGNVIAGVTSLVSEHIAIIASLAAGYVALKLSVAAATAVSVAYAAAKQGKSAASQAYTGKLVAETAATVANTAAVSASTAAKAANTATTVTYTSRTAAALSAVANFSRALGVIGLVAGTAGIAISALSGNMKTMADQTDHVVSKVQTVTNAINQQIAALRERNRLEMQGMGLRSESDKGNVQALKTQVASLIQDRETAKLELDRLNAQFAKKTQDLAKSGMGGALRENRSEELTAIRKQKAAYDALSEAVERSQNALNSGEVARAEGARAAAYEKQLNRLNGIRAEFQYIRDEILAAPDDHGIKKYGDAVAGTLQALEILFSRSEGAMDLSESEMDGYLAFAGKLRTEIDKTRKTVFTPGPEGAAGNNAAIKLFNERFNHQKKLAEDMRNFQLKMLDEERKVGIVSTQQAAEGRERIWAEYQEKLVKAGQLAQAEIGASGAKEAQKEFGSRAIAQKVAAEKERAEQELTQAQIMQSWEDQREALMSHHNLKMELWGIEQDIQKEQEDLAEDLSKRYMSARDVAILEARNRTEDKYTKILRDKEELLKKGVQSDSNFYETEGGKALLADIAKIKEEAPKAGQAMADMAAGLYDQTTSATDGAIRALQGYADEALDVSTQVEQAFTKAFKGIEDALVDLVMTGKADFKSLVKSLQEDFARLAIRQYITGPLAQSAAGMIGGYSGGPQAGQAQQSSFKVDFNSGIGGSLGNTFASLGSTFGSTAAAEFGAGITAAAGGVFNDAAATAFMNIGESGSTAFSMGSSVGSLPIGSLLGYGQAAMSLAEGNYGQALGTTIGTYVLPGIGTAVGGLLGGMADSFFGGPPTTRQGQRARVDYTGSSYDYTSFDSRQAANTNDQIQMLARSSVEMANSMFTSLGLDAVIDRFYAITESSVLGDRQGVASGGTVRAGGVSSQIGLAERSDMTFMGFGGWSEAEMLPRLATDIQLSILQAFQTQVDALPTQLANMIRGVDVRALDAAGAQNLVNQFTAVTQGAQALIAAVQDTPLQELQGLSLSAAIGLNEFSGGVQNFAAGIQAYYQNFYTDSEKFERGSEKFAKALADVGLQMPDLTQSTEAAKQGYRTLAESQDLTTEAGQKAYAVLMAGSTTFNELTTAATNLGIASVETAKAVKSAAEILQEREGLELRWMQLIGDTVGIRARELEALDESNHALQQSIWLKEEELAVASERDNLMRQLYQATGDTVAIQAQELKAVSEANKALQQHVWAMQAQAETARTIANLQNQADQLLGNTAVIRQRELEALDESARPMQEYVYALQDWQAAVQKAEALQQSYNQMQAQAYQILGNTAAVRQAELATMDSALRPMQEYLYALEDWREEVERQNQIMAQAKSLQMQVLEMIGATEEIRRVELETMDAALHPMQKYVWALEDEEKARTDAIESLTKQIEELQKAASATDDAMDALSQRVNAHQKLIETQVSGLETLLGTLTTVFDYLGEQARDLRKEAGSGGMQADAGMRFINEAIAKGGVPDMDQLQEAVEAVRDQFSKEQFASAFDRDVAALNLANKLEDLQDVTGPQMTLAEQQLEVSKQQLAELEKMLNKAQAAIDETRGVKNNTAGLRTDWTVYTNTLGTVLDQSASFEALAKAIEDKSVTPEGWDAQIERWKTDVQKAEETAKSLQALVDAGLYEDEDGQVSALVSIVEQTKKQLAELDSIDLSTGETGVAGQQLTKLGELFTAAGEQVVAIGGVTTATGTLTSAITGMLDTISGGLATASDFEGIIAAIGAGTLSPEGWQAELAKWTSSLEDAQSSQTALEKLMEGGLIKDPATAASVTLLGKLLDEAEAQLADMGTIKFNTGSEGDSAAAQAVSKLAGLVTAADTTATNISTQATNIGNLATANETLASTITSWMEELETSLDLSGSIDGIATAISQGNATPEGWEAAISDWASKLGEAQDIQSALDALVKGGVLKDPATAASVGLLGQLLTQAKAQLQNLEDVDANTDLNNPSSGVAQQVGKLDELFKEAQLQVSGLAGVESETTWTKDLFHKVLSATIYESYANSQISKLEEQREILAAQTPYLSNIQSNTKATIEAVNKFLASVSAQQQAVPTPTPTPAPTPKPTPTPPPPPPPPQEKIYTDANHGLSRAEVLGKRSYRPTTYEEATDYIYKNSDLLTDYRNNQQNLGINDTEFTRWAYALRHWDNHGKGEGRKYASGGYAYQGRVLVGEDGPELLDMETPGRVYNARKTQDILQNAGGAHESSMMREVLTTNKEILAENKMLRQENQAHMQAISKLLLDVYRIFRSWDGQGVPETRNFVSA